MSNQTMLPPGFEDLEPFSDWCISTESGRVAKRMASEFEELQDLYDALMPTRITEALQYLDQFPLDELEGQNRNLLLLTLGLAEINMAIEVYGCVWQKDVVLPDRMPPADFCDAL